MPPFAVQQPRLQDFDAPPLNEVVLGVQFSNPVGYSQIHAGDVRALFKEEYPLLQELTSLQPVFETFGNGASFPQGQIAFFDGPMHDRFWFMRSDGAELVQFQQDRLLHNWRKVEDGTNSYPRFESLAPKFHAELEKVQEYMSGLHPQELAINQCELSYINHIPVSTTEPLKLSDWISFISFKKNEPQSFSFGFREVIWDSQGQPQGRLICEVTEGIKPNGQRFISLTLTARGAPQIPSVDSAMNFLSVGHDLIVNRFVELTTDKAHQIWGYKK
ncbi:TIGR04255 family protein [Rugamonas sp. A1-17]|nr:TIGR04255 family protein [Rugamonas sp. A1-17]